MNPAEPQAVIEIASEASAWDAVDLSALAARAVNQSLRTLSLPPDAFEVSILACDDTRIADLNAEFRGKPTPTNVLSWPSDDRAPDIPGAMPALPDPDSPMDAELGDIAIAFETCVREAEDADKPFDAHVTHLLVHGTLHLLGFDHETDADASRMEALEIDILAALNVANPYETPVVSYVEDITGP